MKKTRRPMSEETKRKISQTKTGVKVQKGPISQHALENIRAAAFKRRGIKTGPCSEERREKIRAATTGVKKTITGPNTGWFKKGQGPSENAKKIRALKAEKERYGKGRWSWLYRDWKRKVHERDGYKCQICGSMQKLHAHHIIPWKENENLRWDIANGITYCATHHTSLEYKLRKVHPRKKKQIGD